MSAGRIAAGAMTLLAAGALSISAADREFNALLSEVSKRYEIRATHIPLMGFVSLCARIGSHGGVRNLHIAEFDNIKAQIDFSELASLVRASIGADWQPFVVERSRSGGDQSVIFVRPVGGSMRMLIADYEHNELDVIDMELNGESLTKWMNNPAQAR